MFLLVSEITQKCRELVQGSISFLHACTFICFDVSEVSLLLCSWPGLFIFDPFRALTTMKTKLKGAQTGHSLLKRKSEALTKRFRAIVQKINDVSQISEIQFVEKIY